MKRKLRFKFTSLLVISFLFLGALGVNAQKLEVTGTISEAGTGELMVAATVLEKGPTNATVCDVMGKYMISVAK